MRALAALMGLLILTSSASARHRRRLDPTDVNYGYDAGYSSYPYGRAPSRVVYGVGYQGHAPACGDPGYGGHGYAPVFQTRTLHEGHHYGLHSSASGHYGTHSGVHVTPDEGLHSGYHHGYHQGVHYGEHSGIHEDAEFQTDYIVDGYR